MTKIYYLTKRYLSNDRIQNLISKLPGVLGITDFIFIVDDLTALGKQQCNLLPSYILVTTSRKKKYNTENGLTYRYDKAKAIRVIQSTSKGATLQEFRFDYCVGMADIVLIDDHLPKNAIPIINKYDRKIYNVESFVKVD